VIWSLHRAVALRARILTWAAPTTVQKHCPRKRHPYGGQQCVRARKALLSREPSCSRTPCQACAASDFFGRPGSGARSVGRRTVPSSKPTPRPKSTRMPRSGLPRVFVRALACTSMQTFGGRCSCTSSVHVRSTQTASSQQHSPQYSPRVRRPSNRRCSAARRSGTATGRHGHQTTPCRKPWRARVCRSTSRPAHPITGLPPILSLNLDMSACLWRVETTVWNFSMSANSEYLDQGPHPF
jgi:hypothetical protein